MGLWWCRIEGKGKGFLQPHQLIAEFEAIPEANRKKLVNSAFGEVLNHTQVSLDRCFSNFLVYVVFIFL